MTPLNRAEDDEDYSLTDGQVTLKLVPWKIEDYEGLPANRPMLDHIGFRVEDADAVHQEILDYNAEFPPGAAPCWLLDGRKQDIARRDQLRRAAPHSRYQYCDANGVCFVTID